MIYPGRSALTKIIPESAKVLGQRTGDGDAGCAGCGSASPSSPRPPALQRASENCCPPKNQTRSCSDTGPGTSKPSPASAAPNSPWVPPTALDHLGEGTPQQPITAILMAFLFSSLNKEGAPSPLHWKASAGPADVPSALLTRPPSHQSHGLQLNCCLA